MLSADNGLIVREKPNVSSERLGKFKYGQKVTVDRKTGINYSFLDNGKEIKGKWLKVSANIEGKKEEGFVFSGFLTEKKLNKRIEIKFEDFIVEIDHIEINYNYSKEITVKDGVARIEVDLIGSPEGKYLKIYHNKYKQVEVFQRYENSVTIMDEGPHCDLLDWKHYYSEWEKLSYLKQKNSYKILSYSQEDGETFIPIKINDLKKAVAKHCGERWSKLMKNVNDVNEYPSGVTRSKVFLKFVLTDENNKVTEKIIEFILPMGC